MTSFEKPLVKKPIKIQIIEGAEEAISKRLLPTNVNELEFSTVLAPNNEMFRSNGLWFANSLDNCLKSVFEDITEDDVQIFGESFISQVVGSRRQFFSGLLSYKLKRGEVEQDISLHAVFRKVS